MAYKNYNHAFNGTTETRDEFDSRVRSGKPKTEDIKATPSSKTQKLGDALVAEGEALQEKKNEYVKIVEERKQTEKRAKLYQSFLAEDIARYNEAPSEETKAQVDKTKSILSKLGAEYEGIVERGRAAVASINEETRRYNSIISEYRREKQSWPQGLRTDLRAIETDIQKYAEQNETATEKLKYHKKIADGYRKNFETSGIDGSFEEWARLGWARNNIDKLNLEDPRDIAAYSVIMAEIQEREAQASRQKQTDAMIEKLWAETGIHLENATPEDIANAYTKNDTKDHVGEARRLVAKTNRAHGLLPQGKTQRDLERAKGLLKKEYKEAHKEDNTNILEAAGYISEKTLAGALTGVENLADALGIIVMSAGQFVTGGGGLTPNPVSHWFYEGVERLLNEKQMGTRWSEDADRRYNPQGAGGRFLRALGGVTESAGNLIPAIASEIFTAGVSPAGDIAVANMGARFFSKGISAGAKAAKTIATKIKPSKMVFGMGAGFSYAQDAYQETGDVGSSLQFGILGGTAELLTESLWAGLAGTNLGKSIIKYPVKNNTLRFVLDLAGEGGEEVIISFADPFMRYVSGVTNEIKLTSRDEILQSGFQGIALSLLMKTATYPINRHNQKQAVQVLNSVSQSINGVILDEGKRLAPLDDNASMGEIQKRQEELKTLANEFATQAVKEEGHAERTLKEAVETIARVGGDLTAVNKNLQAKPISEAEKTSVAQTIKEKAETVVRSAEGSGKTAADIFAAAMQITDGAAEKIESITGGKGGYGALYAANLGVVESADSQFDRAYVEKYAEALVDALRSGKAPAYEILSEGGADAVQLLTDYVLTGKASAEITNANVLAEAAKHLRGILASAVQNTSDVHAKLYGENSALKAQVVAVQRGDFSALNIEDARLQTGARPNVAEKTNTTPEVQQSAPFAGKGVAKGIHSTNATTEVATGEKETAQLIEDYSSAVDSILTVSDEVAKDLADKRTAVEVSTNTPKVILDHVEDARDLKVIVNYNTLYLAVRKDGVFKGHYHNLGADIAKKLPEFLESPDAIIQLASGRLNLFATVETERGNHGIVSVELNSTKDIGGRNKDYNVVVTIFSSDNNYVQNLISSDGVTEKYKREDLSQVNPQLYKWLATINGKSSTDTSISQDDPVVNNDYTQKDGKYTQEETNVNTIFPKHVLPTAEEILRRNRAARAETETERTGILHGVSDEVIQTALRLSEAFGIDIVFYEDANEKKKGYYNHEDGKIYINKNNQNIVVTVFGHEMVHHIQKATGYIDFFRTVLRQVQKESGNLDAVRKELYERYKRNGVTLKTTAEIDQEVVAEYAEKHLFTDEASILSLVEADAESGRKVLRFLDRVLAKLGNKASAERVFAERARAFYIKALREVQGMQAAEAQQGETEAAQNVAATEYADENITEEEYDEKMDILEAEASMAGEKSTNTTETDIEAVIRRTLRPEITSNNELMQMLEERFGSTGTKELALKMQAEYAKNGNIGKFEALFTDGGEAILAALSESSDTEGPAHVAEDGGVDTPQDDGRSYMISGEGHYDYSKSFAEQIDDYKSNKFPENDTFIIGRTEDVYLQIGFNPLPVTIDQTHIDYALNGTRDTDHFLGETMLKQLPDAIKKPVAIIRSATRPNRVVALLPFKNNGKTVVVPFQIDGQGINNKKRISSNAVTSVLGKGNIERQLADALNAERQGKTEVFYWNKKEALSLLQGKGHQLPSSLPRDGFVHSIREKGANVNIKIKNNTKTTQFRRWFGKSKVTNDDGTPKVVYHGTNKKFDIFKSEDGTYWFSESRDYAEAMAEERGGDNIIAAYLSIKNPYYAKLPEGKFSDPAAEKAIIREAKAKGHDGVVIECDTENELVYDKFYVAFEPTQIKSADRNIGTFDGENPKIQYAIAEGTNASEAEEETETNDTDFWDEWLEKVKEHGAMPKGERPARDIKVPKKIEKRKPVSQTVRTILEAKVTPDEAIPTIKEMTLDGDFSYTVYTDKKAISDAEGKIEASGYATAFADWMASMEKGSVSKENTALGWALYNQAATNGDLKTATTILNKMVQHQRNAAQALQATRILKKLSPEGQLYQVVNSMETLQQELDERYEGKAPRLQIDEALAEEFLQARTQTERDGIKKKIYQDIGKQMPSRFIDKWNAWRYLAMLGNARTHVRNIIGNAGFMPVVLTKNLTATAIEGIVHRVSNGKVKRSKAILTGSKLDRALLKAAWEDYDNVAELISNGGKYNDSANANRSIEEGRRVFKNDILEKARKGNSALLELEDVWFARPHYAIALAQFCKANAISADKIASGKGMDAARAYAAVEAQKATYKDTNAFSQMVSEWGRRKAGNDNGAEKAFNTVVEGTLPFRKTPANILVRGVEYSPLGLLKSLTVDLGQVAKGKKTAAEVIDSISAGLTGTGLLALGIFLAAEGLIRGHGGEDEDKKKFEEMAGHQAYSLELPNGTSITLDWLAPEALPFFVGVNLWEMTRGEGEKMNLSTILTAIGNVSEPMLEMSCMQSLNDLFESVGYASSEGLDALPTILASAVTSYLTQALPTILGQAERSGEPVRMTTYTEKNKFLTANMQYTLGRASAKIPGFEYGQIPYVDAWGRVEEAGGTFSRITNNFLNPAYTSKINMSEMEEELLKLYDATGERSVFPERAEKYFTVDGERKDLTAQEYVKYATLKGKESQKVIAALTQSKAYRAMDDDEKVRAIDEAYTYADQQAKKAVAGYTPASWIRKAEASGAPIETNLAFRAMVSDAKENGGGEISKAEVVDILSDMKLGSDDTWAMYLTMYDSAGDRHAHENGISGEEYLRFIDALSAVDEPTKSGKYGTFTQEEAEKAVGRLSGLSKKEKAVLWQSVNTSWKAQNNPFR